MNYTVPFISNTEDDLHCLQSAYLMIAKYFMPKLDIDWNEWSDITGFEIDKGTWASAGLLWFISNKFEVKHISLFDYKAFVEKGGDYLIAEFGTEVGTWQVKHSNIPLEQQRVESLLAGGVVEFREPSQDDIKKYLDDGYLLRCLVNSRKLNGKEGYFGHAVVISGYDSDGFIIQDPGLPPLKDRGVSFAVFEEAWAYPNKEAKELDAIKLK